MRERKRELCEIGFIWKNGGGVHQLAEREKEEKTADSRMKAR